MEQHYCRRCGAPLIQKGIAYTCANDHAIYTNPAPTVGVFLLDSSGNIVLSLRGIEPGLGKLDTIGGFVDENESFEQALRREIEEETGLKDDDYSIPIYLTSAPSTYDFGGETRSVLSCFYFATLKNGVTLNANDDVAGYKHIPPSTLDIDTLWSNDTRLGARALLEVIT